MKRFLVILTAIAMIIALAALVSCGEGNEDESKADVVTTVAAEKATSAEAEKATTAAAATADATTAAENETAVEEGTTVEEATTAATSGRSEDEEEVVLFDASGVVGHDPVKLAPKAKGTGVLVTIPEGQWINGFSFCCPSYNDSYGSLTAYVYKFDTDMSTTLKGTELYKETFEDFGDNEWLEVYFTEPEFAHTLTNGDYVLLLKEGIDEEGEGVGVWTDGKFAEDSGERALDFNPRYVNFGKLDKGNTRMVDAKLIVGFYDD